MATATQIRANQLNAESSSGPTSEAGKQASSRNHTKHGLCQHHNQSFYLIDGEDSEKFFELRARLRAEYQSKTETEHILVQRMADHEWLRMRALRLQRSCMCQDGVYINQLAVYLRYQTTHERAFYKALKELQNVRAQRIKEQIGFESQERREAAEPCSAAAQKPKKPEPELKKERLASPEQPENSKKDPSPSAPTPATSPGDWEMAV